MDIPRESAKRQRRIRRIIYSVLGLLALASVTLGLSRLKPAAPTVERAQVWLDTVKRGDMVRQVRGTGLLVPEQAPYFEAFGAAHLAQRMPAIAGRTPAAASIRRRVIVTARYFFWNTSLATETAVTAFGQPA